jgi:lipopolysaccharide transport system permease protein
MESKTAPKIISAEPATLIAYFQTFMKYKNLVWVFAEQELKTTYAQTYLGLFWAILRPLFTLLIFTLIFKHFLHVPTKSPYHLFAFTGMIAWNFFSQIVGNASSAIIQKQSLIRKMYFPKIILPLSKTVVVSVETGISFIILFILFLIDYTPISSNIFWLPLFIVLTAICGFSIAVWMNTMNVKFRDLNQILPAIIGVAIWVTPVFYPTTIIPQEYSFLLFFNPMAGIIKGYRFAILGEGFPEWQYWVSIGTTLVLAITGVWRLSRVENEMVDYI